MILEALSGAAAGALACPNPLSCLKTQGDPLSIYSFYAGA